MTLNDIGSIFYNNISANEHLDVIEARVLERIYMAIVDNKLLNFIPSVLSFLNF